MLGLEVMKASFDQAGVTWPSAVWVLYARTPIGERLLIELDVPFSHFGQDSPGGERTSETALGNPYVGIILPSSELPLEVRLGARPRLSNRNAALFPAITTDYDHLGAFQSDDLTVRGGVRVVYPTSERSAVVARGEPIVLVNTIRAGSRLAWFVSYGLQGRYRSGDVEVLAGVTGVAWASDGGGSLSQRTTHQLGLTVNRRWGALAPGFHARLPVDGDFLEDEIDFVVGLSLFATLE